MSEDKRLVPGQVWESRSGKTWDIVGVNKHGQALLYRYDDGLGELPGTAGGWKGLTRTYDELIEAGWKLTDREGRKVYRRALAIRLVEQGAEA